MGRTTTASTFSPNSSGAQRSSKLSDLPVFNLLKTFKLQQYTRQLETLGYASDVYKLALLLPRQRHDLLKKLKLMPGHKTKFLSLFEVIDQIYPKSEKFKLISEANKAKSTSFISISVL